MKRISILIAGLLIVTSLSAQTNNTNTSAKITRATKRIPWSGFWWPMRDGILALGWEDGDGRKSWTPKEVLKIDECLSESSVECVRLIEKVTVDEGVQLPPLLKFDLFVKRRIEKMYQGQAPALQYATATKNELDIHYIGNNVNHRFYEMSGFSGKCIGWALSTFDYVEPTKDRVIEGIRFKPADIKGILATIYNGAQFFIPDELAMGNAYHEASENSLEAYEDVNPKDFMKALSMTIDKGKLLEADLDPGEGVWNYPIYKYEMSWKNISPKKINVEMNIYYANDEVSPDLVVSTNRKRPDIKSRILKFELEFEDKNWNGDFTRAINGKWIDESIDNHPDALILGVQSDWREAIYDYKNTKIKEEVNFQLIKRIKNTNNEFKPIVDDLLKEYFSRKISTRK